jgi:hypothetical protein
MLSAELFTAGRSPREEAVVGWMVSIAAWKPTAHSSRDFGHHSMPERRLGRGCSPRPLASEDRHPRLPRNGETQRGRKARSLPCEWASMIFQWGSAASAGGEEYHEATACRARRFGSMSRHRDHVVETEGRTLVSSRGMTWSESFENMCRGR